MDLRDHLLPLSLEMIGALKSQMPTLAFSSLLFMMDTSIFVGNKDVISMLTVL